MKKPRIPDRTLNGILELGNISLEEFKSALR
jgi:hypothetical protein